MQTFKIAHMYPDLMEVYSDRGNVMVLEKRLAWRGIEVRVDKLTAGDQAVLSDYDLVFSGGGEDREQSIVARDLLDRRADIEKALESGTVFLTICGSYQLFGHYFQTLAGKRIEGLGLLDVHTVGAKERLVGNAAGILLDKDGLDLPSDWVIGYENHSGRTFLGPLAKPWLKMGKGFGNNGSDPFEGAWQGRIWGTYLHGPLLAKNPHVADHFLMCALERHGTPKLEPLDDQLELQAHHQVLQLAIGSKQQK